MNLLVEIDGLGGEEVKDKAAARKTHWASSVNPLATHGRPAFAEFANVYAVQGDFAEAVAAACDAVLATRVSEDASNDATIDA